MQKFFCLTAALSAILIPLLPEIAWTRPIFLDRYPEVPNSNLNTVMCYLQTADGRTLNLDRLCRKSDDNGSSVSNTLPGSPTAIPAGNTLPGSPTAIPAGNTLPGSPTAIPASNTLPGSPTAIPAGNTLPGSPTTIPASNTLPGSPTAIPAGNTSTGTSGSNIGGGRCHIFDDAGRPCAGATSESQNQLK